MESHEMLHASGREPYSCKVCGCCFWDHNYGKRHEIKCAKLMKVQKHQPRTPSLQEEKCSTQDEAVTSPGGSEKRRSSLRIQKGVKPLNKISSDRYKYKCDLCNWTCMAESNLRIHKQLHGNTSDQPAENGSSQLIEVDIFDEICDDINSIKKDANLSRILNDFILIGKLFHLKLMQKDR